MKAVHGLILPALLFSMLGLAQQQQPSLGDVARQPKPTKKATRVITDDDMPSRPKPVDAPKPVDESTSASKQAAKPSDASDEKDAATTAKGEEKDSAEVAGLKERLKALENDQQSLTSSLTDLENSVQNEPDPARREAIAHIIAKRRESLSKAKAEHSAITHMLKEQKKSEEK